jgi:hypothetical protein
MNYIIESLFVGFYVCIIYLFLNPFIKNFYLLLLVCGFFKHLLGFYFGIHKWYCNNGDACLQIHLNKYLNINESSTYLFSDSIYEAIIFLFVGTLLHFFIKTKLYLFFIMGALLHIIAEHSGLHTYFCKQRCIKK